RVGVGDFDGDGKTDFAAVEGWNPPATTSDVMTISFARPTAPDTAVQQEISPTDWQWDNRDRWLSGDVNGDGRIDHIVPAFHAAHPGIDYPHVLLRSLVSTPSGTFAVNAQETSWEWDGHNQWLIGDLNGDGKSDVVCIAYHSSDRHIRTEIRNPHVAIQTARSNGDGSFSFATRDVMQGDGLVGWDNRTAWFPADLNGDGKTDLVFASRRPPQGSETLAHATLGSARSNGDGTFDFQ